MKCAVAAILVALAGCTSVGGGRTQGDAAFASVHLLLSQPGVDARQEAGVSVLPTGSYRVFDRNREEWAGEGVLSAEELRHVSELASRALAFDWSSLPKKMEGTPVLIMESDGPTDEWGGFLTIAGPGKQAYACFGFWFQASEKAATHGNHFRPMLCALREVLGPILIEALQQPDREPTQEPAPGGASP